MSGCENDSKTGIAAHHSLISFGGSLERIDFGHRANTGKRAEGEGVLRIMEVPDTSLHYRRPPINGNTGTSRGS
jgi:hypothetical protein